MPSENEKFQRNLLASVQQMKRGDAARITQVKLPVAAQARAKRGCPSRPLRCFWAFRREHCKTGNRAAARPRVRRKHCSVSPLHTQKFCKSCGGLSHGAPMPGGGARATRRGGSGRPGGRAARPPAPAAGRGRGAAPARGGRRRTGGGKGPGPGRGAGGCAGGGGGGPRWAGGRRGGAGRGWRQKGPAGPRPPAPRGPARGGRGVTPRRGAGPPGRWPPGPPRRGGGRGGRGRGARRGGRRGGGRRRAAAPPSSLGSACCTYASHTKFRTPSM